MTKKELEEQIEILKDLVKAQKEIIEKLRKERDHLDYFPPVSDKIVITHPNTNTICADGLPHDFNYPWMGTTPLPCKKCNYVPPQNFTVTCESKL